MWQNCGAVAASLVRGCWISLLMRFSTVLTLPTSMVESRILEKGVGPLLPPSTSPFRYPCSAQRSLNDSAPGVRLIMPIGYCPPCASSSVVTSKRLTQLEETPHERYTSPFGRTRLLRCHWRSRL